MTISEELIYKLKHTGEQIDSLLTQVETLENKMTILIQQESQRAMGVESDLQRKITSLESQLSLLQTRVAQSESRLANVESSQNFIGDLSEHFDVVTHANWDEVNDTLSDMDNTNAFIGVRTFVVGNSSVIINSVLIDKGTNKWLQVAYGASLDADGFLQSGGEILQRTCVGGQWSEWSKIAQKQIDAFKTENTQFQTNINTIINNISASVANSGVRNVQLMEIDLGLPSVYTEDDFDEPPTLTDAEIDNLCGIYYVTMGWRYQSLIGILYVYTDVYHNSLYQTFESRLEAMDSGLFIKGRGRTVRARQYNFTNEYGVRGIWSDWMNLTDNTENSLLAHGTQINRNSVTLDSLKLYKDLTT